MTAIPRLRILALPLSSAARLAKPPSATSYPLVYYYFQTAPRPADQPPSLANRITSKAASLWARFGNAPEGNWRRRLFGYGERLVDKIEFEELALSSLDPSMGPTTTSAGAAAIALVHPSFIGFAPVGHLESLLAHRAPKHRRGFWTWVAIAPLTAPFTLVPVIPNLPFFYAAWRAWSHYRAWKASEYLEGLVKRGLVEAQADAALDAVYAEETGGKEGDGEERVMLSRSGVERIGRTFGLAGAAEGQLHRAVGQARARLKQG
ncbi:mitochondrial K+-H+ exchange-related-domain-containing protein [Vararia minispora EC-137]|uniref:Mitochondrial K+-H+ exchange-related-domain-containing protein n=1 Tax=Vararia minispora EC-137 TaxID=1314806 RepID=A0ACB8QYC0_9AGAM|nr:mitochondrial K+-H+ exchange-related-domain-containing protein [Vararia minispora EC-137]